MKRIVTFLMVVGLICFFGYTTAFADIGESPETAVSHESPVSWCVKYPSVRGSYNEVCVKCHVMIGSKFGLKEFEKDADRAYPNYQMKIYQDAEYNCPVGYYLYERMAADDMYKFLKYMYDHDIKHVIIELHNPGGSIFEMWRNVGLMNDFKSRGMIIETRTSGLSASAAFVVFVNGTYGYRRVSPNALLMWHEIISAKMFDITTPADKEDEARVLRKFQDIANVFLASRSKLSKDSLDEKIHKKELWLTGTEAVEFGFADNFIGLDN